MKTRLTSKLGFYGLIGINQGVEYPHNYVLGDLHLADDVPQSQLSILLARNGFLRRGR